MQTRWRDARKSGNLHRSPRIDPDAAPDSTETNGSLDRRYDWHVLRQRLTSPLAKRLYVYIDSHRGRKAEGGLLYERTIDDKLRVRTNPSFGADLQGARDSPQCRRQQLGA